MAKFDVYENAILNYIKERDGQTILMKDMAEDTNITQKTLKKKVSSLSESGYIRKDGKKFYYIGKETE